MREHVRDFARALRRAGIPVGTDQIVLALRALETVDVTRPDDFYWSLHAAFVRTAEHRELFRQVFGRFWTPDRSLPPVLRELLARSRLTPPSGPRPPGARRAAEAVGAADRTDGGRRARPEGDDEEWVGTAYSATERLRFRDFEEMTAEEVEEARRLIASMRLPARPRPTRRLRSHPRGDRVDLRATLRGTLRSGRHDIPLRWRRRVLRPPPVVGLVDVSGSMEPYSRTVLHFMHALTRQRPRVHTSVFGTRLTNVSRHLRHRDVDAALRRVGSAVEDWAGGTRIATALDRFNRRWSRRVLSRGGVVLLITDGLDRDAGGERPGGRPGLGDAAARLRRSCGRLIWLNPLLRYEGFEPRALGVRALLPNVDEMRPVHDLASLESLARALSSRPARPPAVLRAAEELPEPAAQR